MLIQTFNTNRIKHKELWDAVEVSDLDALGQYLEHYEEKTGEELREGELYDHTADVGDDMDFPGAASDLLNVAEDPAHAATVKELAAMVREGWKGQRPQ